MELADLRISIHFGVGENHAAQGQQRVVQYIHAHIVMYIVNMYICCFLRWPFQVRFQLQVLEQLCCCYCCCCSLHICEVTFNFDDG